LRKGYSIYPGDNQSQGNNLQRQVAFLAGEKGPGQFRSAAFLVFSPWALTCAAGGRGLEKGLIVCMCSCLCFFSRSLKMKIQLKTSVNKGNFHTGIHFLYPLHENNNWFLKVLFLKKNKDHHSGKKYCLVF
jgi:hypothetical protein